MSLFGKRKKEKPTLEQRAKEPQEDRVLNTVEVVDKFPETDFSAEQLWRYFTTKGKIIKIGANVRYDKKIDGSPQMKYSEDGSIYPTVAVFDAELNGSTYRVHFNERSIGGGLEVTVRCSVNDLPSVKNILSQAKREIVSISKTYGGIEPFKKIYDFLTNEAQSMKIAPGVLRSTPQMVVDNEGGLLPVEAEILATINGTNYVFHFSRCMGNATVDVECPLDKTEFVNDLLEKMSVIKTEEGEKEVKSLDFAVSVREFNWDMVGGLGEVKRELLQYIQWPLENPELFAQVDCSMPKGILLIGPSGNGKTTIAKILANETDSAFYTVSPKDINSMWVGGTEKNWGRLFRQAREDVKRGKTAIIFIDEIDGFFTSREEMGKYSRISFGQFCQEMDGFSDLEKVVILAATNRYDDLDPALVRPGRFTKKIYISNPDEHGRREILGIYMRKKPVSDDVDMNYLVQQTDSYSAAQVKELCDSATFNALERYSKEKAISIKDIKGHLIREITIKRQDFEAALEAQRAYKAGNE